MTIEEIEEAVAAHGSIRAAAAALGRSESGLRGRLRRAGSSTGSAAPDDRVTVDVNEDEVVLTMPGSTEPAPDQVMNLIRENGLKPSEWVIASVTLNRWNALGKADKATGENPMRTLRQVKVTLRPTPERFAASLGFEPVVHVPALAKPKARARVSVHEPDAIMIEADHQYPYADPRLDACLTKATAQLRPVEQIFAGDQGDYPDISRHPDHPAAMATAKECDAGVYHMLRRRAEASPDTKRKLFEGNHDWRVAQELLLRAERLYDLTPVGEDEPVWSLRRRLHLDRLGVELIQDRRGWQHNEVELVPGMNGLVVRHGWLTGANNAAKSLEKRGRSIIFGHVHTRQHVFRWNATAEVEQQAMSIGAACLVRHDRFPHFAPCDDWLQGGGLVLRWPDGRWKFEHMEYSDGVLIAMGRRFEA